MSFRDNIANDIERISFNLDQFAETGYFYKKDIDYSDTTSGYTPLWVTMVCYPDGVSRYNGEIDERELGDYTLYLKQVNYDTSGYVNEINVELGDYISLDAENNTIKYAIDKIREETIGSWTCNAVKWIGKREVRRKNIMDFRG